MKSTAILNISDWTKNKVPQEPIQEQSKIIKKKILLQQLNKIPQDDDLKSKFFFLVPQETYVSWLWDMGVAAFLIDKDCNLKQFNQILENLKAEERTRAMLFIFCPCLITKSETDALIKILKEQLLNFKENIWQQIFRNKDYLESRNGERDFKIQIEKYIESQKEHGSGNITTFINAPIQMECGDWICDEQGVYKWVKDKEEENHQVFASKQQILLTSIIENIETGKQKYQLSFSSKRNDKFYWKTISAEPSICSSKNKIIGLSDFGIRVTDSTAKRLIDYLDDLYTLNENTIPVQKAISRLGWIATDFFPYVNDITFDGDTRQKEVVNAIHEQGEFPVWQQNFQEFRKNLMFRLVTDTCFASILIEKIGGLCFLLHLWGGTGKGKTVGLKAAASIWGEPEKLLLSADATDNYATGSASFFKNLPVMIDETQVASNKLDKLIYLLTEGRTRGRLDRNGKEKNANTWTCATILTGEKPLINGKSAAGAANRVIELEVEDSLFKDFGQVMDIIQEHYGFAGKRFVKYIQQQNIKDLRQEYNQIQKEIRTTSAATGKQAASLAFIILADRIANKCIFDNEKPLQLDKLISVLKTEAEVLQSERAYDYIMNWIATNQKCFILNESDPMPIKTLGKIEKGFCYFNQSELIKVLSENNFDFDAIKKDWAAKGYLEKNSQGRYLHQTTIGSIRANYTKLKLSEGNAEFENITKKETLDLQNAKQAKLPLD